MEKLNVNILDYVNKEEIEGIITEGCRSAIRDAIRYSDITTLITNSAYKIVFEIVNKQFNMNLEKMLTDKVTEIIGKLDTFDMIQWGDNFSKKSRGAEIIDNVFVSKKEEIEKKVGEEIANMKFTKRVKDEIANAMLARLTGKDKSSF